MCYLKGSAAFCLLYSFITTTSSTHIVVIGAGTAGISAARYLQDNTNYSVTVVEANDRIGGRINTIYYEGKPIELGAMWIHGGESEDQLVAKYCRHHNISLKTFDFRTLNHSYSIGNETVDEDMVDRKSSVLDSRLMFAKVFYLVQQWKFKDDSLSEALSKFEPLFYDRIEDDNITNYFNWAFIEETYSDSRSKISIREFDNEDEPSLDMVVPRGYQTFLDSLINRTYNESNPLSINMGTEVTIVNSLFNQVNLHTSNGSVISADAVIVTVSLGVLKAETIHFIPPLTNAHKQAIKHIGFGDFGKVVMIFDKTFWPESTEWFVVKSDPPGYPLYFISLKNLHDLNGLIAVITGPNAFDTDGYNDTDVMDKMMDSLRDTFGDAVDSAKLVYSTRTKWSSDPLYRGAYSYGAVGMTSEDMVNVRKPLNERIYFAGEHTMWPDNYATVDVAYQSGIRAAKEVITYLTTPTTTVQTSLKTTANGVKSTSNPATTANHLGSSTSHSASSNFRFVNPFTFPRLFLLSLCCWRFFL